MVVVGSDLAQPQDAVGVQGCQLAVLDSTGAGHLVLVVTALCPYNFTVCEGDIYVLQEQPSYYTATLYVTI